MRRVRAGLVALVRRHRARAVRKRPPVSCSERRRRRFRFGVAGMLAPVSLLVPSLVGAFDTSLGLELRHFPHDGLSGDAGPRAAVHAELVDERYVFGGDWLLATRLDARLDPFDRHRDKLDARTLSLSRFVGDWEIALGVEEVFWGVVESDNIVNIINQIDYPGDARGNERLGQAMLRAGYGGGWGTLDAYALIGFREREYGDGESRFSLPFAVGDARFEPTDEERLLDVALRWQHRLGDVEFALSHFRGTARRPHLDVETRGTPGEGDFAVHLIPRYDELVQWGSEAQLIVGDTLYKSEITHRKDSRDSSWAAVTGIEHTLGQVLSSDADLGLIVEYLYDGRGTEAPIGVFENDVLLALRLSLNDAASSSFTFGVLWDHRSEETSYRLEGDYRLSRSMTLDVEIELFDTGPSLPAGTASRLGRLAEAGPEHKHAFVNDEDHVGVGITWYF